MSVAAVPLARSVRCILNDVRMALDYAEPLGVLRRGADRESIKGPSGLVPIFGALRASPSTGCQLADDWEFFSIQ